MQKIPLLPVLAIIACIAGCSKHHDRPLTPDEILLTSGTWKLQRSDSTHMSYSDSVLGHTSFIPLDCSDQPHYIFKPDYTITAYNQCEQPAKTASGWKWGLGKYLSMSIDIPFQRGSMPPELPSDSVLLLTKDSLVVSWEIYLYYETPLWTGGVTGHIRIIDRYTH